MSITKVMTLDGDYINELDIGLVDLFGGENSQIYLATDGTNRKISIDISGYKIPTDIVCSFKCGSNGTIWFSSARTKLNEKVIIVGGYQPSPRDILDVILIYRESTGKNPENGSYDLLLNRLGFIPTFLKVTPATLVDLQEFKVMNHRYFSSSTSLAMETNKYLKLTYHDEEGVYSLSKMDATSGDTATQSIGSIELSWSDHDQLDYVEYTINTALTTINQTFEQITEDIGEMQQEVEHEFGEMTNYIDGKIEEIDTIIGETRNQFVSR